MLQSRVIRRGRSAARGLLIASTFVAAGTLVHLSSAYACGGFFCDAPLINSGPPIAQAGENVVFVLDRDAATGRGLVEAHVQIIYSGAADQFSWVVPVTSLPVVEVGNDVLFQIVEPKTRPTFNVMRIFEGACRGSQGESGCVGGSVSASSAPGAGSEDTTHQVEVEVAFHGNIGPYETAVIRSDNARDLEDWLTAHQYFVSPDASRIIGQYVETQSYFVALRLQAGRDVSEIQPVVLKLGAEEGCLPLKLTSIATTPNLRVNVWVLGSGRAVPLNYTEVEINPAKLDWFTGGANYDQLVSDAANEAGGNAFTTEYAQPAVTASTWFALPDDAANELARSTGPVGFWLALQRFGLPIQGRVLQLLKQYIPMPASLQAQGVTEVQFYGNLPGYLSPGFSIAFDAAGAAAAMEEQVLASMRKFQRLFAEHAFLTRLGTFISAEEMTKDPLFVTNSNLPAVSNVHLAIARVQCGDEEYDRCGAPVKLDVEGGRTVSLPARPGSCGAYDRKSLDDTMPAARRGWRRDPAGEGDVVLDNDAMITRVLRAHNATVAFPGQGCGGCALTAARGARRHSWTGVATLAAWLFLARRRRRSMPAVPSRGDPGS